MSQCVGLSLLTVLLALYSMLLLGVLINMLRKQQELRRLIQLMWWTESPSTRHTALQGCTRLLGLGDNT